MASVASFLAHHQGHETNMEKVDRRETMEPNKSRRVRGSKVRARITSEALSAPSDIQLDPYSQSDEGVLIQATRANGFVISSTPIDVRSPSSYSVYTLPLTSCSSHFESRKGGRAASAKVGILI